MNKCLECSVIGKIADAIVVVGMTYVGFKYDSGLAFFVAAIAFLR